jgi:hypothetical protein
MDSKLFDEESLRLLKAFFSLRDPQVRAIIVKLVEDAAAGATITAQPGYDPQPANANQTH